MAAAETHRARRRIGAAILRGRLEVPDHLRLVRDLPAPTLAHGTVVEPAPAHHAGAEATVHALAERRQGRYRHQAQREPRRPKPLVVFIANTLPRYSLGRMSLQAGVEHRLLVGERSVGSLAVNHRDRRHPHAVP